MELKETKNIPTSVGINLEMLSERNNSNNHGAYEILYPPKEDGADPIIEKHFLDKDYEKPLFGSVSTLDWLKTWRSLEIS